MKILSLFVVNLNDFLSFVEHMIFRRMWVTKKFLDPIDFRSIYFFHTIEFNGDY